MLLKNVLVVHAFYTEIMKSDNFNRRPLDGLGLILSNGLHGQAVGKSGNWAPAVLSPLLANLLFRVMESVSNRAKAP